MFGEWDVIGTVDHADNTALGAIFGFPRRPEYRVMLKILPHMEEHFEGDCTGVLKQFRCRDGRFTGIVLYDEYGPSDPYMLRGSYDDDTALAKVAPGKSHQYSDTWILTRHV